MPDLTVACVYRPGGDFDASWVWALKRALNRHLSDFEFRCITHVESIGMWRVPPLYDWPKWWAKLDLFRPGIFSGRVLYMDLDTLPVGGLDEIAGYAGEFAMIAGLLESKRKGVERAPLQSGVMAFTPGPASWQLWERFVRDPQANMRKYRGDGEWIAAHVPKADRLQVLYPGQIVSYKADAKVGPPKNARLVCGHGRPRFSSPQAGWAHREWKSLAMREEAAA